MHAFLRLVEPEAQPEVGPDWGYFSLQEEQQLVAVAKPEGFQREYGTTRVRWVCPHQSTEEDVERGYCGRCDRRESSVIADLFRKLDVPDQQDSGDDES